MSSPFSPLDAESVSRAEAIFLAALQQAPDDWPVFLAAECGSDAGLRAEIDALIRDHEEAGPFLAPHAGISPALETEFARLTPEQPGDRIGPYKLLEQIGEGGFGTVWVAEQTSPVRRRVALKIIKAGMDTREVIARFEQERQALALMDHPNIAKVLDAGATALGRPFFVMELVRGTRITDYCDQAQLPTADRLRLVVAVCHAVQHAHQKGIIHRDLKPSNILVTLHDGVPVPKVIDFGVAKATQPQRFTDLTIYTQFEQMIGTPLYMSPEQAELSGLDIDTRSDIYSLGVLLYELLTGRTPFDPDSLMQRGLDEMRRVVREQEPQRPSTFLGTLAADRRTTVASHRHTDGSKLIGQIRGDLDWIVMKALEKDRARRYETATGLAQDLQRHLASEPVEARPPSQLYRFRRFTQRNKLAFAAGTGITAALLTGLAVSTWMFLKEKQARERAVTAESKATTEVRKSQQVAQFLKDMLNGVGPSVALGRDTKMLWEILGKTAERVGKDLKDQPEVEAELRNVIGGVFSALGQMNHAEAMHREALALQRKILGNEGPAVAASLNNLANTLSAEDAEPMHRAALAMRRKLLGNGHPDVAESLVSLAVSLRGQGKLDEAETLAGEAVAICRTSFGKEHPRMAGALLTLASVVGHQGRPAESEVIHREVLEMRKKLLGNDHPDVMESFVHLSQALADQKKLAESESMAREANRIKIKLIGDNDPMVDIAFGELLGLLEEQGRLAEAESLSRDLLQSWRSVLGNEVPKLAYLVNQLAVVLDHQKRSAEAEVLCRESLALMRQLVGNEHAGLAFMLSNLAAILGNLDRFAEAEAVYRDALAMQKRLLGNDHPEVARSLKNLLNMLFQQGKWTEAEILSREGLVTSRQSAAQDPLRLQKALCDLAEPLYRQHKYAEAEALYREALEGRRARAGAGDRQVVEIMASLARLLADWAWSSHGAPSDTQNAKTENAERAREAEILLRECRATRLLGPEAGHWRTTGDVPSRLGGALLAVAFTDTSLTRNSQLAKLNEAETLLLQGNEVMLTADGVDRKYQRDGLARLVHFYQACDMPDKAAVWQQKLDEFKNPGATPEPVTNTDSSKPVTK